MKKVFVLFLLLGLAAYFIWPTRYINYPAGQGPYASQIENRSSRIDRLTGDVFVETESGMWVRRRIVRDELLRPGVLGPKPNTQPGTGSVSEQIKIQEDMQKQTTKMLDEAVEKAKGVENP